MKNIIFVVFLLLPSLGVANDLERVVQTLESEWASIYFSSAIDNKKHAYTRLLNKTLKLSKTKPESPELIFWQATIIASRAEHQNAIEAIAAIHKAEELLLKTIKIKPDTLEGAALIALGSLYYQAPGWPIAFGDNNKAEQFLKKGLQINPNGIDSNYHYGLFLLKQNQTEEAIKYFKAALKGPVREEQEFADKSLKEEIKEKMTQLNLSNPKAQKNQIASLSVNPASNTN